MPEQLFTDAHQLSAHEAAELEVLAGKFFQPRTPITTRELFAGRWPEITKLGDVITQPGLHAIIYGERGCALERTGQAKAFRYRFHNPLLVPFVFMDAVSSGLVVDDQLATMLANEF